MMRSLRKAFDYQKFAGNTRLENMIRETENRYSQANELSEDDLFFVNAAGESDSKPEDSESDPIF